MRWGLLSLFKDLVGILKMKSTFNSLHGRYIHFLSVVSTTRDAHETIHGLGEQERHCLGHYFSCLWNGRPDQPSWGWLEFLIQLWKEAQCFFAVTTCKFKFGESTPSLLHVHFLFHVLEQIVQLFHISFFFFISDAMKIN